MTDWTKKVVRVVIDCIVAVAGIIAGFFGSGLIK